VDEMKVAAISVGYPGVSSVFENMQDVGLCEFIRLGNSQETIIPNDADLYLLGAWHDVYSSIITQIRSHCKGKIGVLVTSSAGQMESTANQIEIVQLNKLFEMLTRREIDYIFFGSYELFEYYKDIDGVKRFPYPFAYDKIIKNKSEIKLKNDVGLFCPSHFRKNEYNQSYGFQMARKTIPELTLHTNTGLEKTNKWMLNYSWMPRDEFLKFVSKMRCNLHISFTESFCYFFAESLALGSPCLISQTIADNFKLPEELANYLVVKNPDSICEISKKILQITGMEDEPYKQLCDDGSDHIKKLSEQNNSHLKDILEALPKV
jgi:hypothetical protein